MTECTLESSVVDWIIEHPQSLRLFAELGIDYSCAGKSLKYVCHQQELDANQVLARLHQLVDSAGI